MRIGIDAASVVGDKGGVGWHTHHLLRALLEVEEAVSDSAHAGMQPHRSRKTPLGPFRH